MRVLIAEDEVIMADTIAEGLRELAIAVDVVYDGADALHRTSYVEYDVIIVDRDLPGVHGDEVCLRLVAERRTSRIIMLTAAGDVDDKIDGLSLGADDYLAKPFVFRELVARVRALARRTAPPVPPVLERAGIRLDPGRRTVTRDMRPVSLTRKEFIVLEELMRAEGGVVSAEHCWTRDGMRASTRSATLCGLRSRRSVRSWATRRSSRPCLAWVTACEAGTDQPAAAA